MIQVFIIVLLVIVGVIGATGFICTIYFLNRRVSRKHRAQEAEQQQRLVQLVGTSVYLTEEVRNAILKSYNYNYDYRENELYVAAAEAETTDSEVEEQINNNNNNNNNEEEEEMQVNAPVHRGEQASSTTQVEVQEVQQQQEEQEDNDENEENAFASSVPASPPLMGTTTTANTTTVMFNLEDNTNSSTINNIRHKQTPIVQAAVLRTEQEMRHQLHRHFRNSRHVIVDTAAFPAALPDPKGTIELLHEAYHLKVLEAAAADTTTSITNNNSSLNGSVVNRSTTTITMNGISENNNNNNSSFSSCECECEACASGDHQHHQNENNNNNNNEEEEEEEVIVSSAAPLFTYGILRHHIAQYYNAHPESLHENNENDLYEAGESIYGNGSAQYLTAEDNINNSVNNNNKEEPVFAC